jgi:hypothetical protein
MSRNYFLAFCLFLGLGNVVIGQTPVIKLRESEIEINTAFKAGVSFMRLSNGITNYGYTGIQVGFEKNFSPHWTWGVLADFHARGEDVAYQNRVYDNNSEFYCIQPELKYYPFTTGINGFYIGGSMSFNQNILNSDLPETVVAIIENQPESTHYYFGYSTQIGYQYHINSSFMFGLNACAGTINGALTPQKYQVGLTLAYGY